MILRQLIPRAACLYLLLLLERTSAWELSPYEGHSFWTGEVELKGYKLVQHHEALDIILGVLERFSSYSGGDFRESSKSHITLLTDPESLEATLKISKYGARIKIQFLVPKYEFYLDHKDPFVLKVTFTNSVDKSKALDINLLLHRQDFDGDVPIAGFHRTHDQNLRDGAIEEFLRFQLNRFTNGEWTNQFVSQKKAKDELTRIFGGDTDFNAIASGNDIHHNYRRTSSGV